MRNGMALIPLVALLAASHAIAAPATIEIAASGPVHIEGRGNLLVESPLWAGEGKVHGSNTTGLLTLRDSPLVWYQRSAASPLGRYDARHEPPHSTQYNQTISGPFRFAPAADAYVQIAKCVCDASIQVPIGGDFDVVAGVLPQAPRGSMRFEMQLGGMPISHEKSGAGLFLPPDRTLRLEAPLVVGLFGGTLTYEDQAWTLGPRVVAATPADPASSSSVSVLHRDYAILQLERGFLEVESSAGMLLLDRLHGSLAGQVRFTDALAHSNAGSSQQTLDTGYLELKGEVEVDARWDRYDSTWLVGGDIVRASADGVILLDDPREILGVAAGIGVGAILSIWATKILAAFLAARLRADALAHPARRAILHCATAKPGQTMAQLRASAGLGRTATVHHVRVLQQVGALHAVRRGKRTHYLPRHLEHNPLLSTPTRMMAHHLAAISHPVRRVLFDVICRHAPISSRDIRALSDCNHVSRQALAYHLNQLRTDGLVVGGRQFPWTPAVRLEHEGP